MAMRPVAMMFVSLMMGVAVIATTGGCTTPTTAQLCPAGVSWLPADFANGKRVPGHCQGYPVQFTGLSKE
jgi:hypothetical protein